MGNFNMIEVLGRLGVQFVPFLFALCFHEFAHGWVAKKRGDNTAELMGRLTLNPFVHADLIGTFVLPIMGILAGMGGAGGGIMFGWAKPVPVNNRNFANPKSDMFWVAFAGPLSNLLLAVVAVVITFLASLFLKSSDFLTSFLTMLDYFVMVNMLLFAFNLIPLHPLDGAKVVARFLPESWNRFLEDNQNILQFVLIGFFIVGGFRYLAVPVFLLKNLIYSAVGFVFISILH